MLKISTFNIQNNFSSYDSSKAEKIIDYLTRNKIDILGLQEVFSKCSYDLEKELRLQGYAFLGRYRFFLHFLLKKFNEKVPVITNKKVISYDTYQLPFLPAPLKRVVTKVVISYKDKLISIYNTHLDFMMDNVKKRELKKLIKLIEEDDNLIILMGDFNLKTNNGVFKEFIKILDDKNICRVDIREKTLKNSKSKMAIDHIFLSSEFNVLKYEVIKSIDTSDHYPILICVEV